MKNASKTMFNIGNIVTIIYLILGGLFFLIGLIMAIAGTAMVAGGDDSGAAVAASGGTLLGWGIYFIATSIVCLILVGKAKRELADESKSNKKPFITTIVVGAIASNIFYVLAGIFGLIAEGQQGQAQEPKAEENKEQE